MKRFADIFAGIKWRVGAPVAGAFLLVLIFGVLFAGLYFSDSRLFSGAQVAGVGAAFSAMTSGAQGALEVDNSAIADIDLDHFDAHMTIADVTENDLNYYVAYTFKTFSVDDSVWKEIQKSGELVITKSSFLSDDVEKYAIEQLRQVVESDFAYLKRVQGAEIASNQNKSRKQANRIKLKGLAVKMKDDAVMVQAPVSEQVVAPEPPLETPSIISTIETVVVNIASTTVSEIAGLVETITEIFASATTTESVATTTVSEIVESVATTTVSESATATTTAPATIETDVVGRRNDHPTGGPRN